MPGFAIQGINGVFGGQAGDKPVSATQEYLYSYTWEIFQLMGNLDSLLVNAKDISTPTFTVGIETQQGASLEYKFAKNVSYDDIKVTFYDAVGMIKIFKEWRETVWTSQDGLKTAESYKRNSKLIIFPPSWDKTQSVEWHLTGSWPSSIRHGELTYTSSDVKLVEVTVTYDFAASAQPRHPAFYRITR